MRIKIDLLNMIWPALYVSETFWRFWFLIAGTIVIELFIIKYILHVNWGKALIASLVGNIVSGVVGTFVMTWGMIGWHLIGDGLLNLGTFGFANWVATFTLMCVGSVLLETLAIKFIIKEKKRTLFPLVLTGNVLSYVFIAFVMFR